jgi:hypothetical protein
VSGRRTGALLLAVASLLAACGGSPREVALTVRLPAGVAIETGAVRFDPPGAVHSALSMGGELALVADASADRLTVRVPGACPVTFTRSTGKVLVATPWFDLGGDRAQVGFDAPFSIEAIAGCPEAAEGRLEWKQIEGPSLLDWRVDERGFHASGRTRPLADVHPDAVAWGIVPSSPRTQGRYLLEATWRGSGPTIARSLVVTSIARSTGVPSLAIGQRIMLAGTGWHVDHAPYEGHAQVVREGPVTSFEPDAEGRWVLLDGAGKELGLKAARYDRMPLGCGANGCHSSEAKASAKSSMTYALARHLDGSAASPPDVSCMLDCHVMGERGIRDGGFLDRAASFGFRAEDRVAWRELPRTLHRLGGVGCGGCHGPAAIPERTTSRSVLRTDVCATCHDAPPRYVHVEQWRASRMARSDEKPETRAGYACSRCHMTSGFLAMQGMHGLRFADQDDLHAEPAGISCAACHASHGRHEGGALVRQVPLLPEFEREDGARRLGSSALCIPCHAPVPDERLPSASAASIWAGRALLPPGGDLPSPAAPHVAVPGGCLGCHGGAKAPTDHSFRVRDESCAGCHAGSAPKEHADAEGLRVAERAHLLWTALSARVARSPGIGGEPAHASPTEPPSAAPTALARAMYEVALVLEDPAAGAHNAPFARALLADAAQALR